MISLYILLQSVALYVYFQQTVTKVSKHLTECSIQCLKAAVITNTYFKTVRIYLNHLKGTHLS